MLVTNIPFVVCTQRSTPCRAYRPLRIMAIVEDATEEEPNAGPGPSSTAELLASLRELSSRLSLPDELLPSFLHEEKRESSRTSLQMIPGLSS